MPHDPCDLGVNGVLVPPPAYVAYLTPSCFHARLPSIPICATSPDRFPTLSFHSDPPSASKWLLQTCRPTSFPPLTLTETVCSCKVAPCLLHTVRMPGRRQTQAASDRFGDDWVPASDTGSHYEQSADLQHHASEQASLQQLVRQQTEILTRLLSTANSLQHTARNIQQQQQRQQQQLQQQMHHQEQVQQLLLQAPWRQPLQQDPTPSPGPLDPFPAADVQGRAGRRRRRRRPRPTSIEDVINVRESLRRRLNGEGELGLTLGEYRL